MKELHIEKIIILLQISHNILLMSLHSNQKSIYPKQEITVDFNTKLRVTPQKSQK
jgi:hypothetical protein